MSFKEVLIRFLKNNSKYESILFNLKDSIIEIDSNLQWFRLGSLFSGVIYDKKLSTKWRYFIKNNLHVKNSCINKNDVIKLKYSNTEYTIQDVDWVNLLCLVKSNEATFNISVSRIHEINGNKIEKHPMYYNEYYITKNKKTYGAD